MALAPGSTIGAYEVTALIGAGGMGEVYRARDPRLGRDVALKLLPADVARDPERLARFTREARILAGLDHPRIARLHHTVDDGDRHVLVMEYVPGETLADVLVRGPFTVDRAVDVLAQVADALDAAHQQHVVHRDLKPANIKLTPQGAVKVLDFGLAKALAGHDDGADAAVVPTVTSDATARGTVMGTAPYMSPEQVRGRPADRRSDIWAFGCLGYELLTGRPAFAGESTPDVFAAVVGREPDWSRLPGAAPPWLPRLLQRCLRKDPAARFRDIGDVAIELADAARQPPEPVAGGADGALPIPGRRGAIAAWTTGAFAIGAAIVFLWMSNRPVPVAVPAAALHLQLPLPSLPIGIFDRPLALSRDGRRLVVASMFGPLRIRSLDSDRLDPVAGTEGARSPFFSPDGLWIGYWSAGSLRRVSVDGGAPITICASRGLLGAHWAEDGRIVFGQGAMGIFTVGAAGGVAQPLIVPDPAKGERSFYGPQLLPGGRAVLFTLLDAGRNWNDARAVVQSIDSGRRTVLVTGATDARYLTSGHLVFGRANTLMAVPLSVERLAVEGTPVPVVERVRQALLFESGAFAFSVSDTGTLAYLPFLGIVSRRLVWVDRGGRETPLPFPDRDYVHARLSPDGRLVAVDDGQLDVWVGDLERGTMRRLTTEHTNLHPVWMPDGSAIVFDSTQGGGLHRAALSGSGLDLLLRDPAHMMSPVSVTPDGRTLAYERSEDYVSFDIATVGTDGRAAPTDLVVTPFKESAPMFSPDGRWLAFVSNRTGADEVYVQAHPGPAAPALISGSGGREPLWSRDGRELFYRNGGAMMAVAIREESGRLVPGKPQVLFQGSYTSEGFSAHPVYDVARDGRFVMVKVVNPLPPAAPVVQVVVNWAEALRARTGRP